MNADIDTNISIAVSVIPKPFYEIQPMICGFNYKVRSLLLSESVSFSVILYDQFNKTLNIQTITINGEDYNNWGNDDTYIIDFICKKLRLIRNTTNMMAPNVTPQIEIPVVETPVVETPVVETPVVETPVVETPVVDTPVVDTPVVDTPVVDTPVVDTPVVE
jgi:hypothetical protein